MQMLDQEVAPPLALAEQCLHLGQRRRIDLPPLRPVRPAPPAGARMNPPIVSWLGTQAVLLGPPAPDLDPSAGMPAGRRRSLIPLHRAGVVQLLDLARAVAEPAEH